MVNNVTIVNVNLIAFSSNKTVGTLIYTKRLFRQINKMAITGLDFVFYAQQSFDFSDFNLPANAKIIRVPNIKSPLLRRLYEHTLFRLKLQEASYIFTPYLTVPLLFSRCKQIVTIHDMVPFKVTNKYSAVKLMMLKFESFIAARLSYKVITVSNNSKKDICKITNINSDKVEVIYNFINNDEVVIKGGRSLDVVRQYGLEKPFFITVSTLQPGKNIERLIRGFELFKQSNPNYQLCIVGNKGWGFAPIYEEVVNRYLENDVVFTGYADEQTLDILYSHCTGVAYVSLYEGFGIPPLEGFYHSKAAIVSNNSSLPEVVGNAAILVDPTDENAIKEGFNGFIENQKILESHIEEQITKFNPLKIVSKFLGIFS